MMDVIQTTSCGVYVTAHLLMIMASTAIYRDRDLACVPVPLWWFVAAAVTGPIVFLPTYAWSWWNDWRHHRLMRRRKISHEWCTRMNALRDERRTHDGISR